MFNIINSLLHQYTYDRLKKILEDPEVADQVATENYNNLYTNVKEISNRPVFIFLTDSNPQLYLMPSIDGLGDYKVYYRVGKSEVNMASLLVLDLNLSSNRGAICSMPEMVDGYDTSVVGLYYSFECKRRNLTSEKRLLNLLTPVQNEVAYKLNMQAQRVNSFVQNQSAIQEEFYTGEEEDYE